MIALSYIISSLAVICLMGAGANVCKTLSWGVITLSYLFWYMLEKWRVME